MMHSMKTSRQNAICCLGPWRWLPGVLLLAFIPGCGEPPQIEEYTVTKSPRAEQPGFQHPPMMGQTRPQPAPSQQGGVPSYDVPKEWKKVANKPLSEETFQIAEGDQEAFVTIIRLGPLTDELLLPNLNRWRGQVDLSPLKPGEPPDGIEDIQLADASKGRYLKLIGGENPKGRQAMLMMFINHGGQAWYFKLMGDAELVLQEEPRFKSFVQSVRFSPKEEAGDE